ncbi:MAG: potassium transporter TrkA [Pseudonocardiaceae bacterium]|nr:potassium transporter TrkA [Pseudonocardiaceae bacterium]
MTPLPGIGTREDFTARSGHRVGLISHRDGHLELIVSEAEDPDTVAASLPLTAEEANTLASLLGAPQLVAQLAEQQRELEDVTTTRVTVQRGSAFDGRTLGDAALRTRTGVSVVAVVRDGVTHPSPRPDFAFEADDRIVMVGTVDGLTHAARIFEQG